MTSSDMPTLCPHCDKPPQHDGPCQPTTVDQELAAMNSIVDALGGLDDLARNRVMRWANDRFYPVSSLT